MKQMIIATKNQGKAKEFKDFLAPFDIKAVSLLELPNTIDDIEETGTTFEQNAALKAETIADITGGPVLADDSGLVIDALDGKPGIFSARYAGESKDDNANIEKVLSELENISLEKRTARFVCVLAMAKPNEVTRFYKGTCDGHIANYPKGEYGFGYDPIFVPNGYSETMAELLPNEKNSISHRKNAFIQLEAWLKGIR
ncbi:XTP/dITP diphosphatase [Virgibacillus oceani]|uniref:dITP/XTP pyrophosphatase n=1 Tax=Virgibacillus oceani TaxID=1479511 RepID=A0A917GZA8_9BACI|nr:XTP/dITP diphosphatase [Virgibacillus oceani]GGG62299.1 non-canonical purine NTP pyrophosphatase [Virgibacillus oceani]